MVISIKLQSCLVDAKAETPVLWPPHVKSWLIGKDPDAGRKWGQEEKGTTEDEMAGWHHWLDGRESGWTPSWWWTGRPGVLQFMGSQRVGRDWVTELNWTELNHIKPCHTPFPILNQLVIPCLVLTVACWSAYRFLRRQVRWSGTPISLRIFHSLLWSAQRL